MPIGITAKRGSKFRLASVWLLVFAYLWSAEAQESPLEILKRQMAAPLVLQVQEFRLPAGSYVAAVLKESFLPEPRVRIFQVTGATLTEVFETRGGGEQLTDLLVTDLTGDTVPEVVTTWLCGQRGLKCISILAWEARTGRFKEVFDAQASQIELGPKEHGKPIEIVLVDRNQSARTGKQTGRRVYVWQRGRFMKKASPR